MEKPQVLIATDNLNMGGSQKSLLAFLQYIKELCDIDILVWQKKKREILTLPGNVKRVYIPDTEYVRSAIRRNGIISKEVLYSVLGAARNISWLSGPQIKKNYDIAIAFTDLSNLKYYVIDKVTAQKKYVVFHNGAYLNSDKARMLDIEYYNKYDKVFVVSEYVKRLLSKALPEVKNVSVLPNRINLDEIWRESNQPCSEFEQDDRIKLLTVIRLYPEKNPGRIVEIARLLRNKGIGYQWILMGDGPQLPEIKNRIREYHLEDRLILTGNESNPYRFMRNCDLYVQFSLYESDSLTVREAACFNKHMILSDIPRFRDCCKEFKNIHICKSTEEAVDLIMRFYKAPSEKNNMEKINKEIEEIIFREIFAEFYSENGISV